MGANVKWFSPYVVSGSESEFKCGSRIVNYA